MLDFGDWKKKFEKEVVEKPSSSSRSWAVDGETQAGGQDDDDDDNDEEPEAMEAEDLSGLAAGDLRRSGSLGSLDSCSTPGKTSLGRSSPSVPFGGKTAAGDGASVAGSGAGSTGKQAPGSRG